MDASYYGPKSKKLAGRSQYLADAINQMGNNPEPFRTATGTNLNILSNLILGFAKGKTDQDLEKQAATDRAGLSDAILGSIGGAPRTMEGASTAGAPEPLQVTQRMKPDEMAAATFAPNAPAPKPEGWDAGGLLATSAAQPIPRLGGGGMMPGVSEQERIMVGQLLANDETFEEGRKLAEQLRLRSLERPKSPPLPSVVDGSDGYIGVFDPTTGEVRTIRDGTPKPPAIVAGNRIWDAAQGKYVVAPGMEDYQDQDAQHRSATLAETARHNRAMELRQGSGDGEGRAPTQYQQFQMERMGRADEDKRRAARRQSEHSLGTLDEATALIDQFIDAPEADILYGARSVVPVMPGTPAAGALAMLEQIGGQAFLSGVEKMRGTGPLSDNEGKRVAQAVTRLMQRGQSFESARQAARELKQSLERLREAVVADLAALSGEAAAPEPQQPGAFGRIAGAARKAATGGLPQAAQESGVTAAEWQVMTPEERALFE